LGYGIGQTPLFWVNDRLMQAQAIRGFRNKVAPNLSFVEYEFTPYVWIPGLASIRRTATFQAVMQRRWKQLGFAPANDAGEQFLRRTTAHAAGKKYVVSSLATLGAKERQEVYE